MSLTNLAQIKGGLQLKRDVAALQKSYEAAKVMTKIAKEVAEGMPDADYNVEELLVELKSQIDTITGGEGISLASVSAAINTLKDKKIKDMVRVEFDVESGVATIPTDFDDVVLECDKTIELPVYTSDNEVVLNENGDQLTVNVSTGAFNGIPSEIDAEASAATTDGSIVYKAKGDFRAKIFPVGEWTLGTIPDDALLDNTEMQLVAYKTSLDRLVIELTRDKGLIDAVKDLVGEKAVQDQLDEALKDINDAIALKASNDSVTDLNTKIDGIDTRVKALEDAREESVSDKIAVIGPVTTFNLSKKPNSRHVEAVINHLTYREGEDFTVDRDTQVVTWTLTEANDGFDIDEEITDVVRFNYFTSVASEATEPEPVTPDPGTEPEPEPEPTPSDPEPEPTPSAPEPEPEPEPTTPDPEPTPADPEPEPAAKEWTWVKSFTMPASSTTLRLSDVLEASQISEITDDSAGGVEFDGVGRKVHLFITKDDKEVELAWNEEGMTPNAEVEQAMIDIGLERGLDFVAGSYYLDGDAILTFGTGTRVANLKIAFDADE